MYTYEQIFADKQNILFVTAHPDDVVVYYGALIPKLVKDKKNIFVVTVTDGCRGSGAKDISEEELGRLRIGEELGALKYLGVPPENNACLGYKDGEVESNFKLIGEIAKYIRTFRADIVCTHEPTGIYMTTYDKSGFFIQHRDHRKTAEAVVDAVYPFSRDKAFFPEQLKDGVEPRTIYEIVMTDEIESNVHLDYTEYSETKKRALMLHKSQFDEGGAQEILDSVKFDGKYEERYMYVKLLW
jgi:LmbE family N-acetylglucosaminyl deacetylase